MSLHFNISRSYKYIYSILYLVKIKKIKLIQECLMEYVTF